MKNVFFLLILMCLSNCGDGADSPNNLLDKETMIKLQIDFQVLDEQIALLKVSEDSSKAVYNHYSQKIYKKHDVNEKDYIESYDYYIENRKELAEIYQAMVDSLSLEKRLLSDEIEEDK